MAGEQAEPVYDSVLITGASAGIGEEFARQLVYGCREMVLVARREDRLKALSSELKELNPNLEISYKVADLSSASERESLVANLLNNGVKPDLLINNAGLGDYRCFTESEWRKIDTMMQVNMSALTHLAHLFIPQMRERAETGKAGGAIINVSSLASILPMTEFAVYAATKAYVTSFSEALRLELEVDNISVLALCPGPVHTEFGSVAMREGADELPGREQFYVDKSEVVEEALAGIIKKKARVYPGWKVALAAVGISMLPMAVIRYVMRKRLNS